MTGGGGVATVRLTVAGGEVPPGPVAVKVKLLAPKYVVDEV